jgi:hypothetical protein
VRYREEHGPFSSREDLDRVPGFAEVRTDEVLSVVDLPASGSRKRSAISGSARGKKSSEGRTTAKGTRTTSSRGGRSVGNGRTRARSAEPTTDHDYIRSWVEERGGWPACVKGTGDSEDDVGMIRIDFPGFSGQQSLERIEWDEWFEQFDTNQLAFLHRDMRHSDGELDRFNKLVKRKASGSRSRAKR